MILSVCAPTFNRATELVVLLDSITSNTDIEVVICDDGSTDNTKEVVESYQSMLNIQYVYQENAGRAKALYNAIRLAQGEFTILMDSDDYFTPDGIDFILGVLADKNNYDSFLFGIEILKENKLTPNLPPEVESNFIAIRADYDVKRDLKEVVRTSLLQDCNIEPVIGCRRVPTYLLWSCVAEKVNCLSFAKAVAVKEYLPGGMSDKILSLKSSNPLPLVDLNLRLSNSQRYSSYLYRWRARLLWARYSFHAGDLALKHWWQWLAVIPGWFIYQLDKRKLQTQQERK